MSTKSVGRRRPAAAFLAAALLAPLAAGAAAAPALAAEPQRHPAPPVTDPHGRYVVRVEDGALRVVEAEAHRHGGRVTREMPATDSFAAVLSRPAVRALQVDRRVVSVSPDASLHLLTSTYTPGTDGFSLANQENVAGVRSAWYKAGTGVDVALVDSGVAPVAGLNDPGKVLNGPDLTPESQSDSTRYLDTFGHGTHMAGIIAGHDSGAAVSSWNSTDFLGVAPNARIVSVKVADAHGNTDVSQVIAGIDWVVQHAKDPGMNIRVLNLSFGTDSTQAPAIDPLDFAAEVAWRKGIVVVVSAGNNGPTAGRLTNPAADPFVLAVGALDTKGTRSTSDDSVASFSNNGDGVRNPDVLAPGTHVQSLRVPGSYIDAQYGSTGAIDNRFFRGSGTSQAAAFVSGSVADLLAARPDLSPDGVKWLLKSSTVALAGVTASLAGNGQVNIGNGYGSAIWRPVPSLASQGFTLGTGLGTLEGSRGSAHQVLNGITLSGEQDLMGQPFDSAAMASAELTGSAWAGGTWNGSAWAGSAWAGSSWAGSAWAGSSWAGSAWAGSAWATGLWDGSAWASGSWAGSTWAGSSWAGSAWAGSAWAGSSYTAAPTTTASSCPPPAKGKPAVPCRAKNNNQTKHHGYGQDDWR